MNKLTLLSIEHELLQKINVDDKIAKFAAKKPGMFALNFSTVICLMEMSYFVVSFILSSLNMSLLGRQEVTHAK